MTRSPPLHILVIEDNDSLREATLEFLNDNGHHTTGVASAEEVDDTPMRDVPDLYLVDVNLPGENGFALTGPIDRGDWETVDRHVAAIRIATPHLEGAYTALVELTSNVVQHALSTQNAVCAVEIGVDERELRATLTDSAAAARIDVSVQRDMPDEWSEAGRGIPFIQALVTRFEYHRIDGRNIWSIVRERKRP